MEQVEQTEPLVGIDPDDTQEVRMGGATFTLGVVDAGLWSRISDEAQLLHEEAQRRAIRRCKEQGLDPEEKVSEEVPDLTRAMVMAQNDPEFHPRFLHLVVRGLRLCLRGHSGFVNRKGEAFPFAREKASVEGLQVEVATEETLRAYRVNVAILYKLWVAMGTLHVLGAHEKKDSPPSPSATG